MVHVERMGPKCREKGRTVQTETSVSNHTHGHRQSQTLKAGRTLEHEERKQEIISILILSYYDYVCVGRVTFFSLSVDASYP